MKKLLQKIKSKFEEVRAKATAKKINSRERLLIIAVMAVVIFIWATRLLSSYQELSAEYETTSNTVAKNELYLSTKGVVKKRLEEKARELHRGTEISGTDLLSIISDVGAQTNLNPESSRPTTKTEGPFDIITVRITVKKAPLENLIEFDEIISNQYASVAVTDARFTPSSEDGMTLIATYEITAFLLRESAKQQTR